MVPPTSHRVPRVPWYSGYCRPSSSFTYGAFTLCGRLSQSRSAGLLGNLWQSITPSCTHDGLGSSAFARRYLRNRCFFLFLRLLRCFSSAGSPCMTMDSSCSTCGFHMWVSPFGNLRLVGYVPLPAAYRSLSRPSSAPGAKASAVCPSSLDLRCIALHPVPVSSFL